MEKKENKKPNNLKELFDEIDDGKKKKKGKKAKQKFNNFQNLDNTFKGLKNFGNSCYSNVVIQILTSINELIEILNKIYKCVENEDDLMFDYPILSRLYEIINSYKSKYYI